jgi:hypothetical protein
MICILRNLPNLSWLQTDLLYYHVMIVKILEAFDYRVIFLACFV